MCEMTFRWDERQPTQPVSYTCGVLVVMVLLKLEYLSVGDQNRETRDHLKYPPERSYYNVGTSSFEVEGHRRPKRRRRA